MLVAEPYMIMCVCKGKSQTAKTLWQLQLQILPSSIDYQSLQDSCVCQLIFFFFFYNNKINGKDCLVVRYTFKKCKTIKTCTDGAVLYV